MEIPRYITDSAKDTVGYSEAANKESFMIGVSVGISKGEKFFSSQIESLQIQLDGYRQSFETLNNDMKTLMSILNKYSSYSND